MPKYTESAPPWRAAFRHSKLPAGALNALMKEANKYKMVEFMQDKIGRLFDGHVSGLTEWGIYVEIEPAKIEGMISLREIRSVRANLEQKILDYELVEE